jgi:hypothetical protein
MNTHGKAWTGGRHVHATGKAKSSRAECCSEERVGLNEDRVVGTGLVGWSGGIEGAEEGLKGGDVGVSTESAGSRASTVRWWLRRLMSPMSTPAMCRVPEQMTPPVS